MQRACTHAHGHSHEDVKGTHASSEGIFALHSAFLLASASSSTNPSASAPSSAPLTPSSSSSRWSPPSSPSPIASSLRTACARCMTRGPSSSWAQSQTVVRRFPPGTRVQAVGSFLRTSQREEANSVTAVILKLQWELDRIPRELVHCGITCLTLFAEGDATDPCRIVARQPARRWPPPTVECWSSAWALPPFCC
jgi:hypothetical protein